MILLWGSQGEHFDGGDARFRVVFRTDWGAAGSAGIVGYPMPPLQGPHTGNMLLVTHNNGYEIFKVGDYASEGIVNSAEFGVNDNLLRELQDDNIRGDIYKVYTGGVLNAPGSKEFEVVANKRYPLLSFATMIAPSPDWFTAVSGVDLLSISDKKTIPLYVYDAGSDSGNIFQTTPKHPRRNRNPITYKTSPPFFPIGIRKIPPIAFLDIIRL